MFTKRLRLLNIAAMIGFVIGIIMIVFIPAGKAAVKENNADVNRDGYFESGNDFNPRSSPSNYPALLDTGDVIHWIPAPNQLCQGLTWDGENLWVSSNSAEQYYKVSPVDGSVLATFSSPGEYIEGMAWDGEYLWVCDNNGSGGAADHIYKLDPSTGNIILTYSSSLYWVHGITFDGEYLWLNDYSTHRIYKSVIATGEILDSFDAPGDRSIGLTWDGTFLWANNFETDSLYQMNPTDGSIIRMVVSPHTNPRDMAWDGQYLWTVAWENSTIYQVDVGTPTSIEDDKSIPERFSLVGNYPNPFNASTVIRYDLPYQSQVTIDVYDILGRQVESINDGLQPAGQHQMIWNAGDLPSGVYFYKLQAGDYTETKRMVLMK